VGILLGSGARESVKTEQTFSIRMTKDEAEGWVPAGKNLFLLDMRFKPEEEKKQIYQHVGDSLNTSGFALGFTLYLNILSHNSYLLLCKIMYINSNKNCISATKNITVKTH